MKKTEDKKEFSNTVKLNYAMNIQTNDDIARWNQVWWCIQVIPVLERLDKENQDL